MPSRSPETMHMNKMGRNKMEQHMQVQLLAEWELALTLGTKKQKLRQMREMHQTRIAEPRTAARAVAQRCSSKLWERRNAWITFGMLKSMAKGCMALQSNPTSMCKHISRRKCSS